MHVAVLLSGGVDSSVALNLLKARGESRLTAFYLKIWLEDELAFMGDCPWETDLQFARAVCRQAGVPLEIISLQSEYRERIVEYVVAELRAGRTPSPDVYCNQRIKFGAFLDAIGHSADRIATGHYARIEQRAGLFFLLSGVDRVKDQTYFLSHLSQTQVARAIFPIGHLKKHEVRSLARDLHLANMDRKDSQGICFLGKVKYPEFIRFHLGDKPGPIVEARSGKILGRHRGYWYYTIGQRQGLGLGNGPWFVVGKNIDENIIFVADRDTASAQATDEAVVAELNWISGVPADGSYRVRIRHAPEQVHCQIEHLGGGKLHMKMQQKDGGVAAGQFAVFYNGEVCLGGGVIETNCNRR